MDTLEAEQIATATEVAKQAAEVAKELAVKTDDSNHKFTQSILELSLRFEFMQKTLTEVKDMMTNKYVTIEAFTPVKNLVYGLVVLILTSVIGAITSLILIKK